MKTNDDIFAVILIGLALGWPIGQAEDVVVDPSKAVIGSGAKAHAWTQHAAQELQQHLQLITGVKIPIVSPGETGPGRYCFHVGLAAPGDQRPLAAEEARWVIGKDAGYLYGDAYPRHGIEFAVSAFLEDGLGVRWARPVPSGTTYEKQNPLHLRCGEHRWRPELELRSIRPYVRPGREYPRSFLGHNTPIGSDRRVTWAQHGCMPRMSRVVVPGLPHHVTQRGVRSIPIFDHDEDRQGVRFHAWRLITNHVHLVAVPEREDPLARGIGEAHRLYTRAKNLRDGVLGYLFQGRFGSCVMDDPHLVRAARYVERNPVSAGIVAKPEDYAWSSARWHLGRRKTDPLNTDHRVVETIGDWSAFLREGVSEEDLGLERGVSSGRPGADGAFVARLERLLGRTLTQGKGGWPKGVPRRK